MAAADRATVIREILALNSPDVPFAYAESQDGVVGVWDYADAKWAGILAAGSVARSYELEVTLPHLDAEVAQQLADRAHEVCPYSNATRGNIDVTVTVTQG